MLVHIVMHESFEAPAAIEAWAIDRHHDISYTRLYKGDNFPKDLSFDLLVVMGGPQSPATTTDECPYFDASEEINLIRNAIEQDKLAFGICLGAQLIGEALGARYEHSPNREIGVFPVSLTEAGKLDPIVGKFPDTFMVGHWHGDMPGLTSEAEILATSEGCPRQIVRYSSKVYGFQCHFEFTLEAIEGMIEGSTEELRKYADLPFVNSVEQLRVHDYNEMNQFLFAFLDQFTDQNEPS